MKIGLKGMSDDGSDHYLLLTKKFRKDQEKEAAHPFAVEKLKNHAIAQEFQLKLENRFQLLQGHSNIKDQLTHFQQTVVKVREDTISSRWGT